MAEEQAKIDKHGSFILHYQEEDIISEELLKKEAVRTLSVICVSVLVSFPVFCDHAMYACYDLLLIAQSDLS